VFDKCYIDLYYFILNVLLLSIRIRKIYLQIEIKTMKTIQMMNISIRQVIIIQLIQLILMVTMKVWPSLMKMMRM
jgi:hypothetical protein